MSEPLPPLLDYSTLSTLHGVFGAKLVLLIDQFILHTDTLLSDITAAIDKANAEDLYFKGQQFKGTSLQMGASQVGKRCAELELLAEHQQMQHTVLLLEKLKQEVNATNQALIHFKQKLT